MYRSGIPIGRVFGISLRLNYSWFIIFILVTWTLVVGYFPETFPDWNLLTSIIAGAITSLLFFGSVLAHELMHSIVSQKQGIPVQSITLFIFGGVSQISAEPKKPQHEFRMAMAGPVTSLVIGIISLAVWFWWKNAPEMISAITFWLGWINIFLAAFNLIPGFPLDGGRVLRSLLWWRSGNLKKATRTASNIGKGVGYLFIAVGVFFVFTGNWVNGIWMALIGWFLQSAAEGSYRQLVIRELLTGHKAQEIMIRDCFAIPPEMTVDQLVDDKVLGQGIRCFPVVKDDKVLGLVTLHSIRTIPRERWPRTYVRDAMVPFNSLKTVFPDTDLTLVMKIMSEENTNQVPVIMDGSIIGMVTREGLLSFINIRSELNS